MKISLSSPRILLTNLLLFVVMINHQAFAKEVILFQNTNENTQISANTEKDNVLEVEASPEIKTEVIYNDNLNTTLSENTVLKKSEISFIKTNTPLIEKETLHYDYTLKDLNMNYDVRIEVYDKINNKLDLRQVYTVSMSANSPLSLMNTSAITQASPKILTLVLIPNALTKNLELDYLWKNINDTQQPNYKKGTVVMNVPNTIIQTLQYQIDITIKEQQ